MGLPTTPTWLGRLLRHEKIRFLAVGAMNTAVDFGILFVLASVFSVPTIVANIISTSVALAVSYLLNKKAVFGSKGANNLMQIVQFVAVTLIGLWVLQGTIITLLAPVFQPVIGATAALFAAKLVATIFSLVWNYLWYSRVVFRKGRA